MLIQYVYHFVLYNYLLSAAGNFAKRMKDVAVKGACDEAAGEASLGARVSLPSRHFSCLPFHSSLSHNTRFYLKAFIYQLISFVYIIKS